MALTNPDKPLCIRCNKRNGQEQYKGLCNACYREQTAPPKLPEDLASKAALARSTEDWQKLASDVAPVLQGILDGRIKASAAQAALLKDIMNRAFGVPKASQMEKRVAAGVIILPALNNNEKMMICPKCGHDARATLAS